jgi:LPS sulfotransferase NodH
MAKVRFVVLTITRSGSTWLVSILQGQPGLTAYEELFLRESARLAAKHRWLAAGSPPRFHDVKSRFSPLPLYRLFRYLRFLDDFAKQENVYGFKLMLNRGNLLPLLVLLLKRYRLICLVRDNVFDGAVSRLLLPRTGDAHSRSAPTELERWHVDPAELVREMRKRRRGLALLRLIARLWPWPKTVLQYDALVRDQPAAIRAILATLDVDDEVRMIEPPVARRIQRPHIEVLANKDEILGVLRRRKLDRHLPASAPGP